MVAKLAGVNFISGVVSEVYSSSRGVEILWMKGAGVVVLHSNGEFVPVEHEEGHCDEEKDLTGWKTRTAETLLPLAVS